MRRCCAPMAASPDPFSNLDFVASENSNQKEKFNMKEIIIITGASSGFGALAARALAKAGHVVYASMRDTSGRNKGQVQEAAKFAADNKADLRTVELDVLSDTSANAAIKKIIDDNGRLDVVVHNAGHMVFGPLEAFTP